MLLPPSLMPILDEVIGGLALTVILAMVTFIYRMWQMPILQQRTIDELRLLRRAMKRIARGVTGTEAADEGDPTDD